MEASLVDEDLAVYHEYRHSLGFRWPFRVYYSLKLIHDDNGDVGLLDWDGEEHYFNRNTRALCIKYEGVDECPRCPVYQFRSARCDAILDGELKSPIEWMRDGRPQKYLEILESILKRSEKTSPYAKSYNSLVMRHRFIKKVIKKSLMETGVDDKTAKSLAIDLLSTRKYFKPKYNLGKCE